MNSTIMPSDMRNATPFHLFLLAVMYVAFAKLGLMLDAVAGFAALVWPPTGLALAAVVLLGNRAWPAIAVGAFTVNLWVGASPAAALGIALGNTLEAVVGATLLARVPGFVPSLTRARDVLALLLFAGVAGTLISATLGTSSLLLTGTITSAQLGETWRAWWLGDVIGVLVVAPVLLSWAGREPWARASGQRLEACVLSVALIGLGLAVFTGSVPEDLSVVRHSYVFYPLLLWAALRFGQRGATLATLTASALAVAGTVAGHGPFVQSTLRDSLFALQTFIAVTSTTFLFVGAAISERRAAMHGLEAARAELEQKVEERTHALSEAYSEQRQADDALRRAHHDLERRVQERTAELSKVNETLSASQARKAAILESSLDSIVTMDAEGLIVDFNPAAEATFGHRHADVVGKELAELLIPPRFRAAHREGFARVLATGESHVFGKRVEFPALRADNTEFPVEIALTVARTPEQPPLFIAYLRDLTERKRSEEQRALLEQRIQEGQKLESLGVLAGGIAHDFNNILTAILGNASLMRSVLLEDHVALPYVAHIEEASRRATDLCRQMLAYAGKGRFVLQPTNLNDLIEETTHLLQISISKKAVLRFHLDARLPYIIADATQIRQVLMNLVINASDAIGERSGVISISTGVVRADRTYLDKTFLAPEIPEGDYVFLEVSDTGVGMNQETQARIFEPFFSSKFAGRGLGLSAVLGIVRGHKGAVKVYSEVGKGSSFKFLLPVASKEQAHELRPRERAPSTFSVDGTVLVVDDEETVRAVAGRMLEMLGFQVLTAADGREALDVYRAHKAEIIGVLMDLTMPHLDGEETFRELRRIDPNVRVLLMSGYNEQDAIARFVGKGLAGFIQKPFNIDELQQHLHKVLA